jgi:lysophospholipase L1-like esterase
MTWNRYAALGDSITEGYGMDPVAGIEPLPWPQRVARGLDAELHNLGRRNLRAAQIRSSQLERALALEPDLVSIAAGANDVLFDDFSREQVEGELEPLYAAWSGTGATVFTFTYMNLPASGLLPPETAERVGERMGWLHDAVRATAERHGALLVDLVDDPQSARPELFSADLMHANAAGHAFVAERTLQALSAIRVPQHA